jgi:c-di-AMP phosphodiesterase-like protein
MSKVDENTLLVIVDTHKADFVDVPELLEIKNKVIIDHHRMGESHIEDAVLTFQEGYASSASELVTEILQYVENDIVLEKIEAESLYAGIMMDTKNFMFKTGVRTFEALAYLRKFGVDVIKVIKWFQSDLDDYVKIADVVKNSLIYRHNIAISYYSEEVDDNINLICAKAADELLMIGDISASFVIGKIGDNVCISGRSIGDVNVQIILEKLRRWRSHNACRCSNRR